MDIYDPIAKSLGISPIDFKFDIRKDIPEDATRSNLGALNSMYGKNHTEESRALMSSRHKGKTISEETKAIWKQNRKGHWTGESNPAKKNPPWQGKTLSDSHKDSISKANKGKLAGDKNPMYGIGGMKNKKHSPETLEKMRQSALKRWSRTTPSP